MNLYGICKDIEQSMSIV